MADLGLSFISPAPQVSANFFLQLARRTEEIGLHSLWLNDRLVYDNFEPLAALAAAAGATSRLRLGTSVLLLPYRRPVLLAKTLATIDFISQGRLTLGVGVGNRASDYDALGVPFDRRGARGLESIQLIRRLWQEDNVTFAGKFFQLREVSLGPKPFNKRSIPIWMGGNADALLKRTGRFADGYICSTSAMANFRSCGRRFRMRLAQPAANLARLRKPDSIISRLMKSEPAPCRLARLSLSVITAKRQII